MLWWLMPVSPSHFTHPTWTAEWVTSLFHLIPKSSLRERKTKREREREREGCFPLHNSFSHSLRHNHYSYIIPNFASYCGRNSHESVCWSHYAWKSKLRSGVSFSNTCPWQGTVGNDVSFSQFSFSLFFLSHQCFWDLSKTQNMEWLYLQENIYIYIYNFFFSITPKWNIWWVQVWRRSLH